MVCVRGFVTLSISTCIYLVHVYICVHIAVCVCIRMYPMIIPVCDNPEVCTYCGFYPIYYVTPIKHFVTVEIEI